MGMQEERNRSRVRRDTIVGQPGSVEISVSCGRRSFGKNAAALRARDDNLGEQLLNGLENQLECACTGIDEIEVIGLGDLDQLDMF